MVIMLGERQKRRLFIIGATISFMMKIPRNLLNILFSMVVITRLISTSKMMLLTFSGVVTGVCRPWLKSMNSSIMT